MTTTVSDRPRTGRAGAWTRERVDRLGRQEIVNLRENAVRLGEPALASLCDELLGQRPSGGSAGDGPPLRPRQVLVPRSRAFAARGVWLEDRATRWSGVRKGDGMVVIAIWAGAVLSGGGACSCLLWAPNVDGARPWSDTAAGRERLEHCKLALAHEAAEGLLVYGEALDDRLPEDRAHTVQGVDPDTVIRFRVEKRGAEYWASWGRKSARRAEAGG